MARDVVNGEVSFEASGETYVMVLNINALCRLEDRLDMSVQDIGAKMGETPRLSFLRTVLCVGLQAHTPGMTDERAGLLIDEIGLAEVGALISSAFSRAFQTSKGAADGDARPPKAKAKAGTGNTSSASGAN